MIEKHTKDLENPILPRVIILKLILVIGAFTTQTVQTLHPLPDEEEDVHVREEIKLLQAYKTVTNLMEQPIHVLDNLKEEDMENEYQEFLRKNKPKIDESAIIKYNL